MTPGQEIVDEAFVLFNKWRKEYDPEGKVNIFDLVEIYGNAIKTKVAARVYFNYPGISE